MGECVVCVCDQPVQDTGARSTPGQCRCGRPFGPRFEAVRAAYRSHYRMRAEQERYIPERAAAIRSEAERTAAIRSEAERTAAIRSEAAERRRREVDAEVSKWSTRRPARAKGGSGRYNYTTFQVEPRNTDTVQDYLSKDEDENVTPEYRAWRERQRAQRR